MIPTSFLRGHTGEREGQILEMMPEAKSIRQ